MSAQRIGVRPKPQSPDGTRSSEAEDLNMHISDVDVLISTSMCILDIYIDVHPVWNFYEAFVLLKSRDAHRC